MKNKKEIISEMLEHGKEDLVRLGINHAFIEKKHAEEGKTRFIQELAKVQGEELALTEWIAFLEEEMGKE